MLKTDYEEAAELPILILTSTGSAVTGLSHTSVTCYIKKATTGVWTAKTLTAANWREEGSGLYHILFTADDFDEYGNFLYRVSDGTNYSSNIVLIADYLTESAQIQALHDLIASRVSKDDIIARERALDEQVDYLDKLYEQMDNSIRQLQEAVANLRIRS